MIKPQTTSAQFEAVIQKAVERAKKAMIESYEFAGETFIKRARSYASFTDRTGNLRSSIGYILLFDGKEIKSQFDLTKGGKEGQEAGYLFAKSVAAEYQQGIALICVAGMQYAAAVESKGFDVITGSVPYVEEVLKTILAE